MLEKIKTTLENMKDKKPLILNLTNYVTMDFMANSLLSIGCAPIMTVCDEELEELINIAGSIHINIGTLDQAFIERCHHAIDIAMTFQKPIILDPVGAGASFIRTKTATALMKHATIVRANASEMMALANHSSKTLGVESTKTTSEAKDSARKLAQQYGLTTVISGAVDFITDGKREAEVPYGSPMMQLVTGMGCALTAIIAGFHAIVSDPFDSSVFATQYMGLCGQLAQQKATGPGTFRTAFIDALYEANFAKLGDLYAQ